jgi:hypothetical protein
MSRTATLRTVAGLLVLQCLLVFAFVYPGYKPKRLLIASAASFTVTQLLRHAFTGATVEDVRPLDPDDPRGATINLLFLPLIGVCFSAVLGLGTLRLRRKTLVGATVAFSALGGLAVAALVHFGLGALPGSYLALTAITALTILAVVLPTAGLHRLLGTTGVAVAGFLFLVFANPASGNGTAPELLPSVWRWLGQLLPPGAGGTALRNTGYFDGAALAQPLVVLATFAIAGALLVFGADRLRRLGSRGDGGGVVVELQPGQLGPGVDRELGEDVPEVRVDRAW